MEDLVILMLFVYPGAISYLLYKKLAENKTFYTEMDSFSRNAWCFFLSIATTVCTTVVFSHEAENPGLAGIIKHIKTTDAVWKYLLCSFIISLLLGLALYGARFILHAIDNRRKIKTKKAPSGLQKKVWANFLANYNSTDCAAIIRHDGKMVRAGMPEILPDDMSEEKCLFLSYCDRVEEEYNKPNHGLLGAHVLSYYDIDTDTEIEFVSSIDLDKKIRKP